MPDLQRRLMIQDDDITSLAIFNQHIDEGKTKEEAAVAAHKSQPVCGDPEDTTHVSGDDRPLPFELKDRINIYVQKRYAEDPEAFKREVKAASTFNAVVRKEIRAGRI